MNQMESGFTVAVSWLQDHTMHAVTFTSSNPPPTLFRCVERDCTKTGFHLGAIISTGMAIAVRKSHTNVHYDAIGECMGSISHNGKFKSFCGKPYQVKVRGKLQVPAPA